MLISAVYSIHQRLFMLINPIHNHEGGDSTKVTHISCNDCRTVGECNASYQKICSTYLSQPAAGAQLIKLCGGGIVYRNHYDLLQQFLRPSKQMLGSEQLGASGDLQDEVYAASD